ncbi:MAG: Uma2 family endonuclease [Synechococcales cyanobacterium RM1_1_8]|nr:Uma2 family endonuclease [Synechococcales cyanobacterium RM1_1_8]
MVLLQDPALQTRFISVQDYHRMIEAEIFGPEERIELLLGQLIPMAAKGSPHSAAVARARDLFDDQLTRQQAQIRLQEPVILQDHSEPEPDLALVKPDPNYYEAQHPQASDVFLIMEVADSSLTYDREIKSLAYAKAGIQDYWVLNLKGRKLHIYRNPSESGYGSELILAAGERIMPLAFGDCAIAVLAMLGQASD